MRKKNSFFERKFYAGVLVVLLVLVGVSSMSIDALTLRFGDDPDTPDQDNHFGVFLTNQSGDDYYLYGHNTTGDDLYLYANSADITPYIYLLGNGPIYLDSGSNIYFHESGVQTHVFDYNNVAHISTIRGGSVAGDDLFIRCNSVEGGPNINMTGGGQIDLDSVSDIYFKELGNQMFKFVLNGDDANLYGQDATTNDLFLYANSVDSYPAIRLEGNSYMVLTVAAGNDFIFNVGGTEYMLVDSSGTAARIQSSQANANIVLEPNGQGVVQISDMLRLNPVATLGSYSPSEGDCYVNSTDHHMYCYLGGGWSQLD